MITEAILQCLLAATLLPVLYSYVLYPLAIAALAKLVGRTFVPDEQTKLPTVTILIAAHNEEAVIHARIKNALEADYPSAMLEVLIASDGSTDATEDIVRSFSDSNGRVKLISQHPNRGKSHTLNRAIPEANGEVIVMSDANTHFHPNAVKTLVQRLYAPDRPLAVCGKLVIVDPASGDNVDGLYWRYETWQKRCEGALGATLGANGGIYGFCAQSYVAIPDNTILDDMTIPLLMRLQSVGRIVFEPNAVATEEAAHSIADEFQRRIRIGTGAYQSIPLLWPLLNPKYGFTSLAFLSHKLLRWFTPHLLILAMLITLAGIEHHSLRVVGAIWLLMGAAVWAGAKTSGTLPIARAMRLLTMFANMNTALFLGFIRWVKEPQTGAWKPTSRDG